jgi:hypothetical protein
MNIFKFISFAVGMILYIAGMVVLIRTKREEVFFDWMPGKDSIIAICFLGVMLMFMALKL